MKNSIKLFAVVIAAYFIAVSCEIYDEPYFDCIINGTVVDEETQEPVVNISVSFSDYLYRQNLENSQTNIPPKQKLSVANQISDGTDSLGNYQINDFYKQATLQANNNIIPVYVTTNNNYKDTIIMVDFKNATLSGKQGKKYKGSLTLTQDIELQRITE
jgi:hypothetical protein